MAKVPSEWNEIFAFQMNMNKTQKTGFKASLSPLPIKGEKIQYNPEELLGDANSSRNNS